MAKRNRSEAQSEDAARDGDYANLLNMTWDDLPLEQLLADGDWEFVGKNAKLMEPKEEGKNPQLLFFYKAVQPVEVSDDLIAAMGDYDFRQNDVSAQIWLDKASAWRGKVGPHLEKHGINPAGKLVQDLLKEFKGSHVIATVGQRNYTNGANELVTQNTLSNFRSVS